MSTNGWLNAAIRRQVLLYEGMRDVLAKRQSVECNGWEVKQSHGTGAYGYGADPQEVYQAWAIV
jgi:hypothetical protein